jgi:hypothetical protein
MPDLMQGVRPLFFVVVPFVVPMVLLLVLPGLWNVLLVLQRRHSSKTRGFPATIQPAPAPDRAGG